MRKISKFNNAEKTVLITGLVGLLAIVGIGFVKMEFTEKKTYVPKEIEETSLCELKNTEFLLLKGGKFNTNLQDYLKGNPVDVDKFKLDLSKVNANVVGSYAASASYEDTVFHFKMTVVENLNPVLTIKNPSFAFVIEQNSKIAEVIEYAGISAIDALGNDITDKVTGWASDFPDKDQTVVYTLKVSDKYGNVATKNVSVAYTILR